ncbi:MAG: hypothetical protein WC651_00365 [Candidatus Gracilibacteria bacterium]|jgi:hypothetical protein
MNINSATERAYYGLPPNATKEQLAETKRAIPAAMERAYYGLPPDATEEQLAKAKSAESLRGKIEKFIDFYF